jgi:uncharacterized protein (TIGR02757 family)
MKLKISDLKEFLDEKVELYNRPAFIESDPISIPHQFTGKEDKEISGFLAASIAWGRRDLILRSSERLIGLMDNRPYEFIINAGKEELVTVSRFVHRTLNGSDCGYFIRGLKHIYSAFGSMEDVIFEELIEMC